MKKKLAKEEPAPAAYDWNSFARTAGGVVGDIFAGPSAAATHSAADDGAHTHQASAELSGGWNVLANPFRALGDMGRAVQQEGLGAFADVGGALDRQDAQRDLASRFNIGGLSFGTGPGENDVTEEEFLAISRQYSDIRRGNTQLKLDFDREGKDPKQTALQESRAMADIADIMQTSIGRDMIGELANGYRDTRIGEESVNNARGGSSEDPNGHKYNYAKYSPGDVHLPGVENHRSDAVLFHELTHAYHSMKGDWAYGEVSDNGLTPYAPGDEGGQVDRSEYQSTGLGSFATSEKYNENAYREARSNMTSGIRTLGGMDAHMKQRTRYTYD